MVGVIVGVVFYGYILFYIGLGIYQPIDALFTWMLDYKNKGNAMWNIKKYLISVLRYALILMLTWDDITDEFGIVYFMIVPIPLAIWHYNNKAKWKQEQQTEKQTKLINE